MIHIELSQPKLTLKKKTKRNKVSCSAHSIDRSNWGSLYQVEQRIVSWTNRWIICSPTFDFPIASKLWLEIQVIKQFQLSTHRISRNNRTHTQREVESTANFDGSFEFEEIGLSHKDVTRSYAELLDLRLGELDEFTRLRQSDFN